MLSFLFFCAPVALYAVLVALPKGRAALKGTLMTAAGLVALWVVLSFGNPGSEFETLGFFALLTLTLAWFIASTLQLLRLRLPDHWPDWVWPLCAIVSFGAVGGLALRFIGL